MKTSDKVNALRAEMISEIIGNVKTIYKKSYNETPVDGNYILDFSDITTRDVAVVVEDDYGQFNKVLLDGIDVSENGIHFTSVDDLGDYSGEIYPDQLNTDVLSWIADIIDVAICKL
jgi:hypothetical protein